MRTDEMHMRRCLALGGAALAAGEVAVGSIVVRGDAVVGEGGEAVRGTLDPSAHAEVQAIRAACRALGSADLSACTLYSTVEPCVLCGYVVRRAGLRRVVYGVAAGQAGAVTSPYAILTDRSLAGWPPPPEVLAGVLADECAGLLALRRPASVRSS